MKVFKVKKTKDGKNMMVEIKATDLMGVVSDLCKVVPVNDLIVDDDYVIRMTSDGKIELGYLADQWDLQ